MGKIHVLDNALANQIAAGEVVERPSSVVKELVENSIDAHSRKVVVKIEDAGRKLISVEDDGDGMDRDDAVIAFKRHATSKIKSTFDLFRISTLGFRGEALPSISSVSHLTLTTSTGSGVGTKVMISEDDMKVEDAPLRQGTLVEVANLFYNTPARLKYMKADYTENANSVEVLNKIALAHPDVSITLYIDGKLQFQTTGRGDLLETIAGIYGYDVARKMIPFEIENLDIQVSGYIGRPELARSNRYYMITLLNGRAVYLPKILTALQDSYADFIPPSRYPFVVLNFSIDYSLVDVNVHPSKREVRFSKEDELRTLLLANIPSKLRSSYQVVESVVETPKVKEDKPVQETIAFDEIPVASTHFVEPSKEIVNDFFDESDKKLVEQDHIELIKNDTFQYSKDETPTFKKSPYRALAQIHKSYIIAEDDEGGFVIVDQHAAQERINYEKFQKIFNSEIKVSNPLVPVVITLNPSDYILFDQQHQDMLAKIGLLFEPFGNNSLKVTQVPSWLNEYDEQEYIEKLIEQVLNKELVDVEAIRKHTIATMSCKASLKAHDYLNLSEMQFLLDNLANCENGSCCPHGRPTIISFSKYQLEKLFKRTGF